MLTTLALLGKAVLFFYGRTIIRKRYLTYYMLEYQILFDRDRKGALPLPACGER